MIIYGSSAAHLKSVQSKTATCPGCKTKGSLVFSIFSRHAHVFWIPLFPFGKTGACQCPLCTYTAKVKEMPQDIRKEYDYIKYQTKTPLWQFIGSGFLLLLISLIVFTGETQKKKELEYITNPTVGDIYKYETEGNHYSTLKVIEINGDSIYLSPNNYETDKMTGIDEIDKEENYAEANYSVSKSDLKKIFDEGTIYAINRK